MAGIAEQFLAKMTLEEKIGQMFMTTGNEITQIGTLTEAFVSTETLIETGGLGSLICVDHPSRQVERIRHLQEIAVNKTRLGIPLLFCQDIVHGCHTVVPIPLACACSFDENAVRMAAADAAEEASVTGVSLTFAPVCDLSRDPRWGRIAESHGEDPFLSTVMTRAFVKGFQDGWRNGSGRGIAATLKHFIGYGAAEGGRDYNTAHISNSELFNDYIPPFRAGIEEGVAAVMPAFNTVDGVPMTGNVRLMRNVLREKLGFSGVTISDYTAVKEMIYHGYARDYRDAALKALKAGIDIEMASTCYKEHLAELVEAGEISIELIDEAVLRILKLKEALGLFDDPYQYIREDMIEETILSSEHLENSLSLARKSMVLLKNDGVLPIKKEAKAALIGPFARETNLCGCWSFSFYKDRGITIYDGLKSAGIDCSTVKGCGVDSRIEGGIEEAVRAAQSADIVILCLGESDTMSGEASSRMNITIPAAQMELAETVVSLGKPVVLVLTNGRPLILDWFDRKVSAILEVWAPGSMGGRAVADILTGGYNPSGKLSVSFPCHTGQIPLYYNHLSTGRPNEEISGKHFHTGYIDGSMEPLYPFGYGLSYAAFEYGDIDINNGIINISVTNTGEVGGEETVLLYVRDLFAEIVRPVKELKAFKKVFLQPGERTNVSFSIDNTMLGYYNGDGDYTVEPGSFEMTISDKSIIYRVE